MYDKLTQSDIQKMEAEIEHRKLTVRPQALDDLKEARSHGDLSENFEYYAAKRFKNQNESRIRYLERMIRTANIISEESAEDEVGLNNTVKVRFMDDGSEESYRIVTTVRGNSLEGLITNESPLGKALLRKKCGDVVHIELKGGGGYDVKIVQIDKTEDDSEDKIRSY
jgi:transcription elongation factor GreA